MASRVNRDDEHPTTTMPRTEAKDNPSFAWELIGLVCKLLAKLLWGRIWAHGPIMDNVRYREHNLTSEVTVRGAIKGRASKPWANTNS